MTDFKQFDVIVISDTVSGGNPPGLIASRAIWGSAVNGNMFIVGGDPLADGFPRIIRQGLRFAAAQAGNAHGRTGLYIALDHMVVGQTLNGTTTPTEIPVLSWFGSFTAVNLQNNSPLISRLVTANPAFNVLGADLAGYNGATVAQGFHNWPAPFVPIAQRIFNLNATPTNAIFYTAPCEADTGYQLCEGQQPLVYILAKPVNLGELTRLVAAQCNVAVDVGQPCNFTAYSTIVPDPNPNNPSGPSTQVSWRVISGPNTGLHGKCTRQVTPPYNIPTGIWSASYQNQGTVNANNFQDVVQLFLDYQPNSNDVFNDLSNSADPNDPDDPAPGLPLDYGTTFTVNWSIPTVIPQVSIAKLASPTAAAEPATDATFRLTRSGSSASALAAKICLGGTATTDVDYELRVASIPVQVSSGEAIITIPAGLSSVDVVVHPLDDNMAEGTETVRMALKDVFDFEHSYVVGGQGFAILDILDNDQPLVTVTAYVSAAEQYGGGAWIFDTGTAISEPLKVYFTLGGTATPEVDYLAALVAATDDSDPSPAILLPSGVGRITISPTSGSPAGPGHHAAFLGMSVFQDSRTEGTESATVTLLPHPGYKFTTASGSVNITDDDSPKIPLGYTITDLGNASHPISGANGLNNLASPIVAGDFQNVQGQLRAFTWTATVFTDLPPIPQLGPTATEFLGANAVNDSGLAVCAGWSQLSPGIQQYYYFLWNGSSMMQLQTLAGADLDNGPQAINDAGTMAGAYRTTSGFFKAGWWNPTTGNLTDLGSLGNTLGSVSAAWAIGPSQIGSQPANRVAGESQFDLNFPAVTPVFHAFRTQPSATPLSISGLDDLGNLLASDTSYSGAYAINNLSEIAGYSATSATEFRAAYKDGNSGKNKGWRSFGVLTGGTGAGLSSRALGLNNVGLIVGWSRSSTGQKAVVWENYQSPAATDLNLKIPVADRPNWVLQTATAINNNGRIVGNGLKNGQQRAFLLTPIP